MTWERQSGPFLLQDSGKNIGKPVSTNQRWRVFDSFRDKHNELDGVVWPGFSVNAVIRPRGSGYTGQQISDTIGISADMVG